MATIEYFLIAGATGRQGGATVDALLTHPDIKIKPKQVYALTRQASGPVASEVHCQDHLAYGRKRRLSQKLVYVSDDACPTREDISRTCDCQVSYQIISIRCFEPIFKSCGRKFSADD